MIRPRPRTGRGKPARIGDGRQTSLGWSTAAEAVRLVCARHNLRRTGLTAAVVGAVLFAINQLDVVIAGHAGPVTWVKAGLTFLVPFCVANAGMLMGTRRSEIRLPDTAE